MARTNYGYAKRQRDLAKKDKKEEKRLRKAADAEKLAADAASAAAAGQAAPDEASPDEAAPAPELPTPAPVDDSPAS
jgi:hypothetical protein